MTRFEQFQQNVQRWATERGIYEHSTALAQALKAVSEVGELCDAVIKNDRDALVDAIGDSAVTLINMARLAGESQFTDAELDMGAPVNPLPQQIAAYVAYHTADMATDLVIGPELSRRDVCEALSGLVDVAKASGLDFDDCCESAWQTIKDRKGRMVAGGAFVKEGE